MAILRSGILAVSLIPCSALAQQTGTAIGTSPGRAAPIGIQAKRVDPPKPTCRSEALPAPPGDGLPDLVFTRQDLVCVRHDDGQAELVRDGLPWNSVLASPTGDLAYWVHEKSELHVFSLAAPAETVVDALPGATMRSMAWSRRGRTLAYFPAQADPEGIRVVDLDSGRHSLVPGRFLSVVASPDPTYVTAVGSEGVERIRVADGRRETLMKREFAVLAAYSEGARWLGVMATPLSPAMTATGPGSTAADDDAPDCTGGSFELMVLEMTTKRLLKVPFPKGFDTVDDFEFSPDERALAVTFGVTGCDYPGEAARVFVVGLDDLNMKPVSPEERLAVEAHWSPDSKMIVYLDDTGSDAGLVTADLTSGRLVRVTNPGETGPDKWLAWR